jgi:hypothetical protein
VRPGLLVAPCRKGVRIQPSLTRSENLRSPRHWMPLTNRSQPPVARDKTYDRQALAEVADVFERVVRGHLLRPWRLKRDSHQCPVTGWLINALRSPARPLFAAGRPQGAAGSRSPRTYYLEQPYGYNFHSFKWKDSFAESNGVRRTRRSVRWRSQQSSGNDNALL